MKTLLITGATGFIGGHLLKAIKEHSLYSQLEIVVLSSANVPGYKTIVHDNYSISPQSFIDAGVLQTDIVIHAGAFTPKTQNDANDINNTCSNVSGLNQLINNLPSLPEKFIFLSTLDVYDNTLTEHISEASLTRPMSLYGWSKLFGEKILETWAQQNKIVIQILRIGHVYGEGEEKYKKLIPVTISRLLNNERPVIYSNGEEHRSFLYISDCINNILAAIDLDKYEGPINIASGKSLPVKEIVALMVEKINPELKAEIKGNNIPVRQLCFNNNKMLKLLDIEKVSLEEGITNEIKYMRNLNKN